MTELKESRQCNMYVTWPCWCRSPAWANSLWYNTSTPRFWFRVISKFGPERSSFPPPVHTIFPIHKLSMHLICQACWRNEKRNLEGLCEAAAVCTAISDYSKRNAEVRLGATAVVGRFSLWRTCRAPSLNTALKC